MEDLVVLTRTELLALAGLVRLLAGLDGRFTAEKRAALRFVGVVVADPESGGVLGEERWWAAVEESVGRWPDEASIRAAAIGLTRPAAREAIREILAEVARADFAEGGEAALLRWVERTWSLPG